MSFGLIALLATASAEEVVVYASGSAVDALTAVELAVGADPRQLRAYSLDEVFDHPPVLTGPGADLERCATPTRLAAEVRDRVERAGNAVSYGELVKAATLLQEAEQAAFCLSEPVEPRVLSRLFYVRGVVAVQSHELALARDNFGRALSIASDLPWDENFPTADGLELFEQERRAIGGASVTLAIVPPLPPGGLYVDGSAEQGSALMLKAGRHLVQVVDPVTSGWITVPIDTESTLVIPQAMPTAAPILSGPEAAIWTTALAACVGNGTRVYVVDRDMVWSGNAGSSLWTPTEIPGQRRRAERRTPWLTASGALLMVGGGVGLGTSYWVGRQHQADAADAMTLEGLDGFRQQYEGMRTLNQISGAVVAAGGVVTVTGVVLEGMGRSR